MKKLLCICALLLPCVVPAGAGATAGADQRARLPEAGTSALPLGGKLCSPGGTGDNEGVVHVVRSSEVSVGIGDKTMSSSASISGWSYSPCLVGKEISTDREVLKR